MAGDLSQAEGSPAPKAVVDHVRLCAEASGLDEDRVRALAEFARERNQSLPRVLVDRGGVDETQLLERLARILAMPFLAAEVEPFDKNLLKVIPPSLALERHVIPVGEENGVVRVACSDPFEWERWDELAYLVGRRLSKVLCPSLVIEKMLKTHHGIGADTLDRMLGTDAESNPEDPRHALEVLDAEAGNAPTVVNLLNKILAEGIQARATDIHFEPFENRFRIRYRVDGILEDASVPQSVRLLRAALISRLKVMANLDITEKRLPQDGRCQVTLAGQPFDLRISIMPGIHGEAVVIRLQSRGITRLALETLGFEAAEVEKIARLIARPHGLFLVTGPTGSGKTTTLYACLNRIVSPDVKIITIEDPVEYWMDNILQMQVHQEIEFTFARALRHMLRHDPDVMLVGEIRDMETAEIAIRSSLTGHLVFATLHANSAMGAPTRLVDIGVEPYLVANAVHGVLAQRLVRNICPHCKREVSADALSPYERAVLDEAGLLGKIPLWRGAGCEQCRFMGYRGRTVLGEVLEVSAPIRQLIQRGESAEMVQQQARQDGMTTLRESGLRKIVAGVTTVSEVLRVTQDDV